MADTIGQLLVTIGADRPPGARGYEDVVSQPRSVLNIFISVGRVAIVSGGGKGLARSFCLALARQGAKVVVNNHNPAADAAGRVVAEIAAAGGEAVADYGDAVDAFNDLMAGDGL